MSADRYTFGTGEDGELVLIASGGAQIRSRGNGSVAHAAFAAIRQLCADLAAVSAERDRLRDDNAALLAANRDCKDHFDALKGDYDEAAHFARHFIRDDPSITPRGAIIRLGAKCMDDAIERAIAAAPPVPTVEVTSELCLRVNRRWMREPGITDEDCGREMIAAVQSELGPALGLVAWREPSDSECYEMTCKYHHRADNVNPGRAMFAAVKEVLGGG